MIPISWYLYINASSKGAGNSNLLPALFRRLRSYIFLEKVARMPRKFLLVKIRHPGDLHERFSAFRCVFFKKRVWLSALKTYFNQLKADKSHDFGCFFNEILCIRVPSQNVTLFDFLFCYMQIFKVKDNC